FSIDRQVFISQHLGDLETVPAFEAFQQAIANMQQIYERQPTAIACDLHPDYRSTQFAHQLADQLNIPVIPVQHHYAHVLSCMAEHQLAGSGLGIAWDGSGYGLDGTLWGGEFLRITDTSFQRVAHLHSFPLPGGSKAVREPRRSALGLLYQTFNNQIFEMGIFDYTNTFSSQELKALKAMLNNSLNTPMTSSAGRLFDAIAAILGLRQSSQFEGQAAMELEFAIEGLETNESYPFLLLRSPNASGKSATLTPEPITINWEPMVQNILMDSYSGSSPSKISARFHNTLVEMMVAVANQIEEERVILSGGCFQNQYLLRRAIQRFKAEGFQPYWPQQVPANDGGIALGQVLAALRSRL
ncbi:MAG: carbamoyltransferase HypF, partial [Kovacikia sp.]